MAATGSILFDGIAITTIEADLLKKSLTARAAFVNTRKGTTHGWTEGTGTIWSEETKQLMSGLVTSMERDLGNLHFTSVHSPSATPSGTPAGPAGLGEHLNGKDAPSV
jgi:hypothetical protein